MTALVDTSLRRGPTSVRYVEVSLLARLQNHNATDDDNVDFRSFKKFCIESLENKYNASDLLVQKLLNDMTLDWYPLMDSSLHTRQT